MNETISLKQFAILVFMNTLGTAIIFIPSFAANFAKENAWLTVLFSTIVGLIIIWMYASLFRNYKEKNFFKLIDLGFGKWFRIPACLFFLSFVYLNSIANLWAIGEFISVQVLMGTPSKIIMLIILTTATIAVRYGLEVITRTMEVFFPFTILSILALCFLVAPKANIENALPIFQTNQLGTVIGIIPIIAVTYMELVILFGILEHVNDEKKIMKSFLIGGGLSGLVVIVITFLCIIVLGVDATIRHTYPIYVLGQKISIADFIQRIEGIVAFIWFFTIFFKIAIDYYVLAKGLQHLLHTKGYQSLTIPLAYLLFYGASNGFKNSYFVFEFVNGIYLVFVIFVGIFFPISLKLLLILKGLKR